jgi:hypothetical protein
MLVMGAGPALGVMVHRPGAGWLIKKYVVMLSRSSRITTSLGSFRRPAAELVIVRPSGPGRAACGAEPWPTTPITTTCWPGATVNPFRARGRPTAVISARAELCDVAAVEEQQDVEWMELDAAAGVGEPEVKARAGAAVGEHCRGAEAVRAEVAEIQAAVDVAVELEVTFRYVGGEVNPAGYFDDG